ncbi:MAG: hypothetical protein K0R84_1567 [Clostridia bacterium]|nr:hypothetical protein [Clostridia bacterium]
MNMSSLRITKTDALLGIKTTPAKVNISQPKADLEIHQKHAKVIIDTEPVQIRIDQSQCFSEAGLKNNRAFMEDNVQNARQEWLRGIGETVSEGNMMADIKGKGNAFAEIAFNNAVKKYDFNVKFIPTSRPVIDFVGGNLDIQVDEGYVDIQARQNRPIYDVEVGGIEFYMLQNPELKIEYVGNELDVKL